MASWGWNVRGDTGTGTAAGALAGLLGDIESAAQVREVGDVRNGPVGGIPHAGELLLACFQRVLGHLAQVAGAAVRRVVRGRPEGDRLGGARAHGEVLLDEELVFT